MKVLLLGCVMKRFSTGFYMGFGLLDLSPHPIRLMDKILHYPL